jgi:hypothetical protein
LIALGQEKATIVPRWHDDAALGSASNFDHRSTVEQSLVSFSGALRAFFLMKKYGEELARAAGRVQSQFCAARRVSSYGAVSAIGPRKFLRAQTPLSYA